MYKRVRTLMVFIMMLMVFSSMSALAVKVGDMLPDFELTDLQGNKVSVSDYQGQYVLYDVWATWCQPCISALKAYQTNYETIVASGVKIVAISVDSRIELPQKYIADNNFPFTVLYDQKQNPIKKWGVTGIPALFLVDPEGKVVYLEKGFGSFEQLWSEVDQVVNQEKYLANQVKELKQGNYHSTLSQVDYIQISQELESSPLQLVPEMFAKISKEQLQLSLEPSYTGVPSYSKLLLGDKEFPIVNVYSGEQVLPDAVYFDFNSNGDVTDYEDALIPTVSQYTDDEKIAELFFDQEIMLADGNVGLYRFVCFYLEEWSGYVRFPLLGYWIEIDTDKEPIQGVLIDANVNGKYTDEQDLILLDLNRNSRFDSSMGQEWFYLKNNILLTDNTKYIFTILNDGEEIQVEMAK